MPLPDSRRAARSLLAALAVLTLGGSPLFAAVDTPDDEVFDHDILAMSDALARREYAKVIDMTYTPIILADGGRDLAIAQAREIGYKMNVVSLQTVKPFRAIKGSRNDYVVVPTHVQLQVGSHHFDLYTYQLAIRPLGQKGPWQYADGAVIRPAFRAQFFPDMPPDAVLPVSQMKELD